MATEKHDYLEFKLGLIERTVSLYIQRMDIWEDQFYKIKYGGMAVILAIRIFIENNFLSIRRKARFAN